MGCPALVRGRESFCDRCRPAVEARRGTAAERGYDGKWHKASRGFLAHHPHCRECSESNRVTVATVVDHIIPHRGDKRLFWDRNNWQPLCASCHSRKTATEDGGFGHAPTARTNNHARSTGSNEAAETDGAQDPEGFLPAWAQ